MHYHLVNRETQIDTAEKMILARVALLGIFAFRMMKQEKLLQIDFVDAGMEATIIVGPGKTEELNNKILATRHEASQNRAPTESFAQESERQVD